MSRAELQDARVPANLRKIVAAIMRRFTICGLTDGMFIANRIARVDGTGNGGGEFTTGIVTHQEQVAEALRAAYGQNIEEEDLPELCEILRTGKIDPESSLTGLRRYIQKCKAEMAECDLVREHYLKNQIKAARDTCEWLMDYKGVRGAEPMPTYYRYGMRLRGFSPGAQPKAGLVGRMETATDGRTYDYWDILVYDRRLSPKEVHGYDLDFMGIQTTLEGVS